MPASTAPIITPRTGRLSADAVSAAQPSQAAGPVAHPQSSKKEWGSAVYTGCDGLPDGGQRLVREGVLAATVVTPSNAGPVAWMLAPPSMAPTISAVVSVNIVRTECTVTKRVLSTCRCHITMPA